MLEQENKFTIDELKLIQNTVKKLFYVNSYYSRNNLLLNEKYENPLKVVEVNDCESNQKSSKRISHKKVESSQINMTTECGIKPKMNSSKTST